MYILLTSAAMPNNKVLCIEIVQTILHTNK